MKCVILAAGKGERLEPLTAEMPKCMLPLAGKPIIEHILMAVKQAGVKEAVLVIGYKGETIREYLSSRAPGLKIKYAVQKRQLGTGDALRATEHAAKLRDIIVLNGDTLLSRDSLGAILHSHSSAATIGTMRVKDVSSYGTLSMNGKYVKKIVEKPKTRSPGLVNAGIYAFSPKIFDALRKIKKSRRGEYELTSAINELIKMGEKVRSVEIKGKWLDVGTPWDYLDSNKEALKDIKNERKGTVEKFAVIKGAVSAGKGSIIKSGSYIEGQVFIGDNSIIGPNAFLRGSVSIGNNCKIGNSVEVKNSVIMDGTKIPHLSYVGDSIIGRNCNIGAGTLVGNLRLDEGNVKMNVKGKLVDTGRQKFGCVIGDNAKIGLNVMINAGRKIGENSKIGPGVIVYSDVPPNAFIRQKQDLEHA